jgi:hypothetical protein
MIKIVSCSSHGTTYAFPPIIGHVLVSFNIDLVSLSCASFQVKDVIDRFRISRTIGDMITLDLSLESEQHVKVTLTEIVEHVLLLL